MSSFLLKLAATPDTPSKLASHRQGAAASFATAASCGSGLPSSGIRLLRPSTRTDVFFFSPIVTSGHTSTSTLLFGPPIFSTSQRAHLKEIFQASQKHRESNERPCAARRSHRLSHRNGHNSVSTSVLLEKQLPIKLIIIKEHSHRVCLF